MSSSSYVGALSAGADRDVSGYYLLPASPAQQRLWFLCELDSQSNAAYNVVSVVRLSGAQDRLRLQQAVNAVVARHESLRTGVALVEGVPQQLVLPAALVALPLVDCRELSPPRREARVRDTVADESTRGFSLDDPPLVRMVLLQTADDEHVLVVTMHHIVCDGWSMEIFYRDLVTAYTSLVARGDAGLSELPIQYADYVAWQKDQLSGDRYEALSDHWTKRLAGLEPVELPLDHPRPPVRSNRGDRRTTWLSAAVVESLKTAASVHGSTLYMQLLAAFDVLLAAYGGSRDIAVGTPVAGREHPAAEELIGFFANTLVLRSEVDLGARFEDVLAAVRETCLDAFSHQEMPFDRLVELLRPRRDLGRTPLFQVMFAVQNTPGVELSLPGIAVRADDVDASLAKFDLWMTSVPEPDGGLRTSLDFNTDLFDGETIERFLEHFTALVAAAVRDPARPVTALVRETAPTPVAATGEDEMAEPVGSDVLDLVARGVLPDAVALHHGELALTHAELAEHADRITGVLGAVPRNGVVALHLPAGPDLAAAVLGLLRAGRTVLALAPESTPEHVALVAERVRPAYVLDDPTATVPQVIGTSSDTGEPASIACVLHPVGAVEAVEVPQARLAQQTSVVAGLLSAADVVHVPADASELVVLGLTAAWAAGAAATLDPDVPATVVLVPSGGQSSHEGPRRLVFGAPAVAPRDGTTVVHGAPTTPVTGTTSPGEGLMLGACPPGVSRHVLGADDAPTPAGTVGRLWVGEPNTSDGGQGGQLLATSELVRRRTGTGDDAGAVEFVGRVGKQQRLGDRWVDRDGVARVLAALPGVREAAVIAIQLGDETMLTGWLVGDPGELGEGVADAELARRVREAAGRLLPDQDVPSLFGVVDALPRTEGGGIDERALHARRDEAFFGSADATPPTTDTERRLVGIFRELLDSSEVGVHANFFGLGGHSMLAARLMSRVRKELGIQVPVREFFRRPTVAGLAEAMDAAEQDRRERAAERGTEPGTRRALASLSDVEVSRLLDGLR